MENGGNCHSCQPGLAKADGDEKLAGWAAGWAADGRSDAGRAADSSDSTAAQEGSGPEGSPVEDSEGTLAMAAEELVSDDLIAAAVVCNAILHSLYHAGTLSNAPLSS